MFSAKTREPQANQDDLLSNSVLNTGYKAVKKTNVAATHTEPYNIVSF